MNTKIFLSAMLLAGGVALTTGCSDFLEAEDKSNISSDAYFVTEQGFEDLSTTPYYKLRALYGDNDSPKLFCSGTDLYAQGRSGYASAPLSTYRDLTPDNTDVLNFYTACYDGIQQCNTVIHYAESGAAGDNVAKRVDEAKALKAYYYYLLTQQFGSVPVSDDYIASAVTSFPRVPQKDVYEYIIGILEGVEQNNILPMDDHTGRISMRTVYNFLAKVYLAYAWDTNTTANADGTNVQVTDRSNFAKAAAYADKAINGQTPSMSFSDMWDVANEDNNDILFAIKYTRGISGQDEADRGLCDARAARGLGGAGAGGVCEEFRADPARRPESRRRLAAGRGGFQRRCRRHRRRFSFPQNPHRQPLQRRGRLQRPPRQPAMAALRHPDRSFLELQGRQPVRRARFLRLRKFASQREPDIQRGPVRKRPRCSHKNAKS